MKNNRDVIQILVDGFSTEPVCVADALSDGRFFLDEKYDALSRRLGDLSGYRCHMLMSCSVMRIARCLGFPILRAKP